jgi:hypothetical protein
MVLDVYDTFVETADYELLLGTRLRELIFDIFEILVSP